MHDGRVSSNLSWTSWGREINLHCVKSVRFQDLFAMTVKSLLCVCAKSLQSCPILWDAMDCSLSDSHVRGILQTRILEWVAMPASTESSWPRDQSQVSYVSCIGKWFFTISATWEAPTNKDWLPLVVLCSVAELCLTLCKPMNCSPPDFSVRGIFQARILEWVAISSSGDLPGPGMEPVSLASPACRGILHY